MRAAVLESGGELKVDEVDVEDPRAGEVLVRVTDCGICHSDYGYIDGSFPGAFPIVLGHEAAGVVEAVGTAVEDLEPGDKVVLCPLPNCGRCYYCVRDQPTLCAKFGSSLYTATRNDGSTPLSRAGETVYRGLGVGGWAERTIVPQEAAVKVPDDTDLGDACVIGCAVQTGVGAVLNTAAVEQGATVLVTGAGGVGIAVVQGARLAGAAAIVVADPVADRRDAALRFGATHVVDPDAADVTAYCQEVTGGIGVDYAFEAAGIAALAELGLNATRTGGTTVCIGAPPLDQSITIPLAAAFVVGQKTLMGCALGTVNAQRDIPMLLAMAKSGRLDLAGMITHRFDLDHIGDAVDNLRDHKGIRSAIHLG